MANLLPIGRFSSMCRLSVKTLRHYDELGLLRPAVTDPSSGYRYYTYGQANRAEAIRVLRSVDMPLGEIREALDSDDDGVVAKLLDGHRARLDGELRRRTRMLAFLQRLIDREEGVMPYHVTLKHLPAQHVASVHRRTTAAGLAGDIAEGFGRVAAAAAAAGIPLAGPPFLVMDDVIDANADGDIQVGFPVAAPFPSNSDVTGEELPARTVASTVHRGPYDEITPAYHTLQGWVQEHGHEVAGSPWEVYLTDPHEVPDPADYVTEVQLPLR